MGVRVVGMGRRAQSRVAAFGEDMENAETMMVMILRYPFLARMALGKAGRCDIMLFGSFWIALDNDGRFGLGHFRAIHLLGD